MSSLLDGDYYELLGVDRDAEAKEIKEAFRAQARRLHPDVCREADADRFAELSQAHAVLSSPTSRILYDRVGRVVPHP
jgi:DnaJ-class molecular chaperone